MSKSPVFYAPSDDPALRAAMERARATFKYLWRELTWEYRRIVPALELSAVKAAFIDDGARPEDMEHMWLGEVLFDGSTIIAKLLNAPNTVRSVREGDEVTLTLDRIEDWMYAREGHVYGGFTIQAMRARMSPAERAKHDAMWGYDFGDPRVEALVPPWPETGGDPDAEHPMSENMAPSFEEEIAKDPRRFLRTAGPSGMTMLHSLALGGSNACVRVLLANGADPLLRTKSGKTPRDLAEQMGWPRVAATLREAERTRAH